MWLPGLKKPRSVVVLYPSNVVVSVRSCGHQDAVLELRDARREDLRRVAAFILSHAQLAEKSNLVLQVLAHVPY